MALQFNEYLKSGTNSIIGAFATSKILNSPNAYLLIYPNTISYPSSAPTSSAGVNGLPGGNILSFSIPNAFSLINGNNIVFTAGSISNAASAAGTLSWFAYAYANSTASTTVFISDSITLAGGGGILTVNTLTPSSGQIVTINFSLKLT